MGQETPPLHFQEIVVDLNAQLLLLGEATIPAIVIEGSIIAAPVCGSRPRSIDNELVECRVIPAIFVSNIWATSPTQSQACTVIECIPRAIVHAGLDRSHCFVAAAPDLDANTLRTGDQNAPVCIFQRVPAQLCHGARASGARCGSRSSDGRATERARRRSASSMAARACWLPCPSSVPPSRFKGAGRTRCATD